MFTVDQEARIREMIVALGPGGTRPLAERALAYAQTSLVGAPDFSRLGGLAEVAALVDKSRQAVSNWIGPHSKLTPPEPEFRTTATPIWDLRKWAEWGRAHPELMGPEFDPFAQD
jgi:hypothetical protein